MHYEKTENKIVFRMKTFLLFTGPFSSEEQPMWTLNLGLITSSILMSCEAATSSGCSNDYGSKGGSQAQQYIEQQD